MILQPIPNRGNLMPSDPIHVRALRGELDADTCSGCGEAIALHYDTTGCLLIGCLGAAKRRQLGLMERRSASMLTFGDPHWTITRRLQWALQTDCGPAMASFCECLGEDGTKEVARVLSEHAIRSYLEETKGGSR